LEAPDSGGYGISGVVLGGGRATAGVREHAETFTDLNRAQAFRLDVENAGNSAITSGIRSDDAAVA
jgi:hypothetical protein